MGYRKSNSKVDELFMSQNEIDANKRLPKKPKRAMSKSPADKLGSAISAYGSNQIDKFPPTRVTDDARASLDANAKGLRQLGANLGSAASTLYGKAEKTNAYNNAAWKTEQARKKAVLASKSLASTKRQPLSQDDLLYKQMLQTPPEQHTATPMIPYSPNHTQLPVAQKQPLTEQSQAVQRVGVNGVDGMAMMPASYIMDQKTGKVHALKDHSDTPQGIQRPDTDEMFRNVHSAVGLALASNFAKDAESKYRFDVNKETRQKQRGVDNALNTDKLRVDALNAKTNSENIQSQIGHRGVQEKLDRDKLTSDDYNKAQKRAADQKIAETGTYYQRGRIGNSSRKIDESTRHNRAGESQDYLNWKQGNRRLDNTIEKDKAGTALGIAKLNHTIDNDKGKLSIKQQKANTGDRALDNKVLTDAANIDYKNDKLDATIDNNEATLALGRDRLDHDVNSDDRNLTLREKESAIKAKQEDDHLAYLYDKLSSKEGIASDNLELKRFIAENNIKSNISKQDLKRRVASRRYYLQRKALKEKQAAREERALSRTAALDNKNLNNASKQKLGESKLEYKKRKDTIDRLETQLEDAQMFGDPRRTTELINALRDLGVEGY